MNKATHRSLIQERDQESTFSFSVPLPSSIPLSFRRQRALIFTDTERSRPANRETEFVDHSKPSSGSRFANRLAVLVWIHEWPSVRLIQATREISFSRVPEALFPAILFPVTRVRSLSPLLMTRPSPTHLISSLRNYPRAFR